MSEVEKFNCMLIHGFPCMMPKENGLWVQSADFDAAQVELAALREELAKSREAAKEELDGVKYTRRKFRQERDELQQRLTAAEQRNAALNGLLRELRNSAYTKGGISLAAYIDPHINPTESGASE